MDASLLKEWDALLERRRKFNTSGQDGSDFAEWCKFRNAIPEPTQMELFV